MNYESLIGDYTELGGNMHKLRKALSDGAVPVFDSPLAEKVTRSHHSDGGMLTQLEIGRYQRRQMHQRHEDRFATDTEYAHAEWRSFAGKVRVINFSSNGLQIETDEPADIGEAILIELGGCGPVTCAVRWIRDGRIGLEFEVETAVLDDAGVVDYILENIKDVLTKAGEQVDRRLGVERRGRAMRHGLAWVGALRSGDEQVPVQLRNISRTGAMLHLDVDIDVEVGACLVLDLGTAGQHPGTVQWVSGLEVGLNFDEKFEVSNLVHQVAADVDMLADQDPEPPAGGGNCSILAKKGAGHASGLEKCVMVGEQTSEEEELDTSGPLTLQELYRVLHPQNRSGDAGAGMEP